MGYRLLALLLAVAVGALMFINVSLYIDLGVEGTEAVSGSRTVSEDIVNGTPEIISGVEEQARFLRQKEALISTPRKRPEVAVRDPFGIASKIEKKEIVFPYKLVGVAGDEASGWVGVLSDGSRTVFVKEGDTISEVGFIVRKITPEQMIVAGPKEIRLNLGAGKE